MPPELIIAAFVLDHLFGDPRGVPHPVQLFGYMVTRLEAILRPLFAGPSAERYAGGMMVLIIVLAAYLIPWFLLSYIKRHLGYWAWATAATYLAYTTISVKSLKDAATAVLAPLRGDDLQGARDALSMIVGRDTRDLPKEEVVRGAVETVAENASDGVVAPLFYLAVGGVPLALAYKAINTMDSMAGYKSDRYIHFGMAAARLDDLANFIPARFSGFFMVVACWILSVFHPGKYDVSGSWRVFMRDRKNHASPNSGHPEAAMAGAIGVRLGGESSYFGVTSVKPYIGAPVGVLTPEKLEDAVRLMFATSVIAVVVSAWLASIVDILASNL